MTYIIAGLSVLIAALALYVGWKNQRRIVAIEEAKERDRIHEKLQAKLTARFDREAHHRGGIAGYTHYLAIDNHGAAEARDIDVRIMGKPLMEMKELLSGQKEIRRLGPLSTMRYQVVMHDAFPSAIDVEIAWADDSGEPGSYRTTLTR